MPVYRTNLYGVTTQNQVLCCNAGFKCWLKTGTEKYSKYVYGQASKLGILSFVAWACTPENTVYTLEKIDEYGIYNR